MSFLNPILLFGLAGVSIPILVHLLNRRKFDRVVWAAMRFLRASVERNRRRLRIEDLLLLILRCSLLAVLALALARPAVRAAGGLFGQARVTAVVIVDQSYSMGATAGAATRFDQAKDAAEQAIDALPADSRVALVLASDVADPVIAEPAADTGVVKNTLRHAKLTDRGSNLYPSVQAAIDILARHTDADRREIYLFTDGQRFAFEQLDDIAKALDSAKPDVQSHIVLLGQPLKQNLAVTNVEMDPRIPAVSEPLPVRVTVKNFGDAEATSVKVSLKVDGEAPCDEGVIDSIPRAQSRGITLFARLSADGYHTVTASIPADRLPADDTRTIALRAVSKVNVLLVDGKPAGEARDSAVFFLRNALRPITSEQAARYVVRCTTTSLSDVSTHRLEDYDAVVFADVGELPDPTLQSLPDFVQRGGGLMIFPGEHARLPFYNEVLLRRFGLLPATLGEPLGDAKAQDRFVTFQSAAKLEHPIVNGVWTDPAREGSPSDAHVYRWFPLKLSDGARAVLNFSDGSPAIAERQIGQGRVVLFASTADTQWTDLPDVAGVWVPLVQRTLAWLIQGQGGALNLPVGGTFVFHPSADVLGRAARLKLPKDGRDSRTIELRDGRPTLTFDNTPLGGAYELKIPGEPRSVRFATQPDSRESQIESLNDEQLRRLASVADVIPWTSASQLHDAMLAQHTGSELWLPLAVAALVLALTETFLADWFSRAK